MKADIIVKRRTNDQPEHVHVRDRTRGPAATARAFHAACQEEFERLQRSRSEVGFITRHPLHVLLTVKGDGFSTAVEIEAVER